MRAFSGQDLIELWERSEELRPEARPAGMLAYAYPELQSDELDALSIGERDRLLLRLRQSLFGPVLQIYTTCPSCGQEVEFRAGTPDLISTPSAPAAELTLSIAGFDLRYRVPNSADGVALTASNSLDDARSELLRRCLLSISRDGKQTGLESLPASVVEALEETMDAADPLADVRFDLSCPECGHVWAASFDPASFLSTEIAAYTRRLFREVHALARYYGWQEADILRMSPQRRATYLEMAV
jgi:hypothetical protein